MWTLEQKAEYFRGVISASKYIIFKYEALLTF